MCSSDLKLALEALDAELARHAPRIRRGRGDELARTARRDKFDAFDRLAASGETQVLPERLVSDMRAVLPRDAVVVCDPGTPCPYFSAYYNMPVEGRHFISNRAHGALGYSMAAAVGAHFGRPQAKCVAVMGDGSFGFTAGEMETIVRLRIPLMMVVVSNSVFGWIKASQKVGYQERYFSVDFGRTEHAKVAEAFGVKSWRVQDPAQLDAAIAAALAHPGPALIDVVSQQLQDAATPVSQWMG